MLDDPDPRSYTYEDAAKILRNLGFEVAPNSGTSHRKWRFAAETAEGGRHTVVIGLVERGSGTLLPVYVREMLRILRENDLLPDEV